MNTNILKRTTTLAVALTALLVLAGCAGNNRQYNIPQANQTYFCGEFDLKLLERDIKKNTFERNSKVIYAAFSQLYLHIKCLKALHADS